MKLSIKRLAAITALAGTLSLSGSLFVQNTQLVHAQARSSPLTFRLHHNYEHPVGTGIGEIITFNDDLYDTTDTTKSGTLNGFCIQTTTELGYECSITIMTSNGQISLQGPMSSGSTDDVITVVGGTGSYDGAHGEGKATLTAGNEDKISINLLP